MTIQNDRHDKAAISTGWFLNIFLSSQLNAQNTKALVGGTLIDGFGGIPVRNSVMLLQNDRIQVLGKWVK